MTRKYSGPIRRRWTKKSFFTKTPIYDWQARGNTKKTKGKFKYGKTTLDRVRKVEKKGYDVRLLW